MPCATGLRKDDGLPCFVDQLFAAKGVPVLQKFLGDDAGAYLTPRGGPKAGPFPVILWNAETQTVDDDSGKKFQHIQIADFPRHDGLPFWSGVSLVGLVVTIEGVDWSFELVESLSDSMATVKLNRRATTEVTHCGFRRK